ncbi:hypothetical protein MNV49_002086 [Pseudohyphozyma bogoriensis]|nr:hypothetical protein MNV49_002086 [Pseudohyphozyma bogoriensis]
MFGRNALLTLVALFFSVSTVSAATSTTATAFNVAAAGCPTALGAAQHTLVPSLGPKAGPAASWQEL